MVTRALLVLLTALLLVANQAAAADGDYSTEPTLSAAVAEWVALPASSPDSESEEGDREAGSKKSLAANCLSAILLPVPPALNRSAERPQARAPPHIL